MFVLPRRPAPRRNRDASYVTVHWEGADRHAGPGDKPEKEWRSEPKGWLAATAEPGYHTRAPRPAVRGCREVDVKHADKVAVNGRKPILGSQFGRWPINDRGGPGPFQFWLLRFGPWRPARARRRRAPRHLERQLPAGRVRGAPEAARVVGLWFADFKEVDGAAPSAVPRRAAAALSGARERAVGGGSGGLREDVCDARRRGPRGARNSSRPASARTFRRPTPRACDSSRTSRVCIRERRGVAAEALRAAFAEACVEAGGGPLNCSAVCHSYGGWLEGGATGRARLSRLKSAMAPGGGDINVFWPERGDKQLFQKDRSTENVGLKYATQDRGLEQIKAACAGEALTRLRVAAHANERGADKYVYTPHLMLYVLHDAAGGIKRLLLSSANLSAAAWGRRRSHKFPERRERHPDGRGRARGSELRARRICAARRRGPSEGGPPFVFPAAAAGQCQREFIGVISLDRDDRGVMHCGY